RYWIILPECPVVYHEAGQTSQRIGLDSAQIALQDRIESGEHLSKTNWSWDTLIKKPEPRLLAQFNLSGNYELVYAVRQRYFRERQFFKETIPAPRVCIEGIRVSDAIPGFGNEQPCALLSVRGSPHFRTTVSRAGLEIDEGYSRVARLCSTLLFNHITEE